MSGRNFTGRNLVPYSQYHSPSPFSLTLQMLSKEEGREGRALRGAALSTETPLRSFTASKRKKHIKKNKYIQQER